MSATEHYVEQIARYSELEQSIDQLADIATSLEAIASIAMESANDISKEMADTVAHQCVAPLGITVDSVSTEGFKKTVADVWKTIVDAIKKAFNHVVEFFVGLFDHVAWLERKGERLITMGEKLRGKTPKNNKVTISKKTAQALSTDGVMPKNIAGMQKETISYLERYMVSVHETVRKLVKGYGDLFTGVKARFAEGVAKLARFFGKEIAGIGGLQPERRVINDKEVNVFSSKLLPGNYRLHVVVAESSDLAHVMSTSEIRLSHNPTAKVIDGEQVIDTLSPADIIGTGKDIIAIAKMLREQRAMQRAGVREKETVLSTISKYMRDETDDEITRLAKHTAHKVTMSGDRLSMDIALYSLKLAMGYIEVLTKSVKQYDA